MPKSQPKATPNGAAPVSDNQTACYALSLSLENVRCFGPKVTLDLSDGKGRPAQWTIILGENGTGKSTLLQAMVCCEIEYRQQPVTTFDGLTHLSIPAGPRILVKAHARGKEEARFDVNDFRRNEVVENAECKLMLARMPSLLANLGQTEYHTEWSLGLRETRLQLTNGLSFFAYGAGRRLGRGGLTQDMADDPAGTLFDEHATVRNAEEWLLRLDYSSSKPSEVRAEQKARLVQVKELLVSILPDVEDIRFTTPTGPNPTPRVEFKTFSGWVPLRRLGYGYQTLIAWVTDFASRMVERYPDSADPLKEPAIVVVDEIDLHLHPAWQRKLIGFLSERFPNTQFIATAHSPLVVQAAANANLAVLKRVGDHVEIVNDVDEIRGWRVDQILTSDLFGLKSARPPEVEELFARKQALLDKSKLSAHERKELQEIQTRIDKLPVGETARSAKEMEAIREALELLMEPAPK